MTCCGAQLAFVVLYTVDVPCSNSQQQLPHLSIFIAPSRLENTQDYNPLDLQAIGILSPVWALAHQLQRSDFVVTTPILGFGVPTPKRGPQWQLV